MRRAAACIVLALATAFPLAAPAFESGEDLRAVYRREVDRRLDPPADEVEAYAERLRAALRDEDLWPLPSQFFVLVDRAPHVQAVMVFWQSGTGALSLVGASPCSTGRPGTYEHFDTPLGVFGHSLRNPDFRAEGTFNEQGIRGYGVRGMRIFDFGWVAAPRGWGPRGPGVMRLQMHATDPGVLESRLGTACSKGCIRIPASLNVFLDRYGILDAEYEGELARGRKPAVLRPDRVPTDWPGRYLVVTDSRRTARPDWARLPPRRKIPAGR